MAIKKAEILLTSTIDDHYQGYLKDLGESLKEFAKELN